MSAAYRWYPLVAAVVPAIGALVAVVPQSYVETQVRPTFVHESQNVQAVVVSGTVLDADNGRPVEAAQIVLLNRPGRTVLSATAASTDASGNYSIQIRTEPREDSVAIVVRRIGYIGTTQTVSIAQAAVILNVKLKASANTLSWIEITGTIPKTERSQVPASVGYAIAADVQEVPTTTPIAAKNAPAAPVKLRAEFERRKASETVGARERRADGRYLGGSPGDREQYDRIEDNPFLDVRGNPRSTFSIDVDRAAYGNVRRFLTQGQKPPADAVRIEEMVNYFPYELNAPRGRDPIAVTTEVAAAPWQTRHRLVRVALQARRMDVQSLPPSNLVFLIDVSGSMSSPDKLPLVKQSLRMLVDQLREQDRVAIVVYAGNAGLVLQSTSGADRSRIAEAIDRLEAGGSTAGGAGIQLAYRVAQENFLRKGNNRVILATDGDFNVGASSDAEMERLIESKRGEGTYLTVLGFGTGNYQDAKMEKLAKKGNGNYAYVDNISEARKTLVHELGATLVTVANDVKLQIEFNPAVVSSYRLIGYEDRLLRDEDFNDDRKDAGDIGSGHAVTALYEVVPIGVRNSVDARDADAMRYPANASATTTRRPSVDDLTPTSADEMMYVKLRYKTPGDSTSKLMTKVVPAQLSRARTSDDFRFAASVASFGMLLRDSEYKGTSNSAQILDTARGALGEDVGGYRAEFVQLIERWQEITRAVAKRD